MADNISILQSSISDKIRQKCKEGYQDFDKGDPKSALRQFYNAWTLLPKPQTQWQEAGWVLTAMGDAYFAKGDYELGREALLSALHCPSAMGNPIIHLRLGQCHWELGEKPKACAQFNQVVTNGGKDLFDKENQKYFDSLESTIAD